MCVCVSVWVECTLIYVFQYGVGFVVFVYKLLFAWEYGGDEVNGN